MLANQSLTGIQLIDKMAALLSQSERLALQESMERGYLVTRAEQRDLQRAWTLWCMKTQCPDIRVEQSDLAAIVTMHLGPCRTTLSADGMHAIKRAFQRYGDKVTCYQTSNWCKHPCVPYATSGALATDLVEIAYLDGVAAEI